MECRAVKTQNSEEWSVVEFGSEGSFQSLLKEQSVSLSRPELNAPPVLPGSQVLSFVPPRECSCTIVWQNIRDISTPVSELYKFIIPM